ncbi:hypothetical protein TL16_g01490 [Triparma laevis f. inornata]|uniref:Magnesium transporter n=1 Tax=Triparma laevis f. inornata TaxID=1714386 RepID=A0A9W7DRK1_9STRA|nr:hypothetical protein TL16_g01490 [Triparma laevis f. inornata]
MSTPTPSSNISPLKLVNKITRRQNKDPSSHIPDNHRKSLLSERLSNIIVFELLSTNDPSDPAPPGTLRNMRLRDLYNYVLDKVKLPSPAPNSTSTPTPTPTVPTPNNLLFNRNRSFSVGASPTPHPVLGGYLHPRDMRRMVTPFSPSNPPSLIIRRHVLLINIDPLRAIVLRDRLLLLVPDGADDMLVNLEKSVRGGLAGKEDEVFGGGGEEEDEEGNLTEEDRRWEGEDSEVAFELVCLDSVLQAACVILQTDFVELSKQVNETMDELRGLTSNKKRSMAGSQERLRVLKNEISILESRVGGFQTALGTVLDEDEDLALMNLSRLVSDPERFVQPVSREVLEEEGDEPELILEAYSQQR